MSRFTQASHALADRLQAGEHQLYNQDLRQVYGLARVTVKARGEIADALERAGLEVLSDPVAEPLVVRKLAAVRARRQSRPTRRAWWRRPWALAGLGLLLLFILVGALSGDEPTAARDGRGAQRQAVAPTPEATSTPAQTLVDARAAVREDDYEGALVIAAALGDDEERGISKRIARRLAYRAMRALRTDRRAASRLLREARRLPRHAGGPPGPPRARRRPGPCASARGGRTASPRRRPAGARAPRRSPPPGTRRSPAPRRGRERPVAQRAGGLRAEHQRPIHDQLVRQARRRRRRDLLRGPLSQPNGSGWSAQTAPAAGSSPAIR